MKELAVVTVHKSVHLRNLVKMVQQSKENIRAFSARLTGTAEMCGMSVKCITCQVDISYRDEVVRQIIITGMFNLDVRQRVPEQNKDWRAPHSVCPGGLHCSLGGLSHGVSRPIY